MQEIPNPLMERMERESRETLERHSKGPPYVTDFFIAGAQALWSALTEGAVEFDEHEAEQALSVEGDYICDEAIARVKGARWQFDQNKAQLEAMRAECTMWKEKYIRDPDKGEEQFLKEENANLKAALEYAKTRMRDHGMPNAMIAEISKLENYHVNLRTELAKARKAIDHITMGIPSEWAFADMRKQRDEVQAKLDEIILYMPKVPTEPYEKRLARTCEQYKSVAAQLAAACVRNPSSGSCIEALKEYNKLMETKK